MVNRYQNNKCSKTVSLTRIERTNRIDSQKNRATIVLAVVGSLTIKTSLFKNLSQRCAYVRRTTSRERSCTIVSDWDALQQSTGAANCSCGWPRLILR